MPMIVVAFALVAAGCGPTPDPAAPIDTTATIVEAAQPQNGAAGGARGGGTGQTLDQMLARSMNRFVQLDTDGDGKLTQDELNAASQRDAPGSDGGDNAQGRRGGGGLAGRGLARDDVNGDGVVTRDEVQTATRDRFKRLDSNSDGLVTRDEIMASFAARARGEPAR